MDWTHAVSAALSAATIAAVFAGVNRIMRTRTERAKVVADIDLAARSSEVNVLHGICADLREQLGHLGDENAKLRDDVTACLVDRQMLRGTVDWLKVEIKRLTGNEAPPEVPPPRPQGDSKEWGRGKGPGG